MLKRLASVDVGSIGLVTAALFLLSGIIQFQNRAVGDETKSVIPPTLQVVVAEGVGTTTEEALKDAYRSAVRQVVGAVVDVETLVKNDAVIDDKVLTYSDGFIKTYEEVPGSKKIQSGLHRLKIKATVERRNVVAKLKAANVTMKEIDGKGLFAEVVTQLDAEQGMEAMLRKEFEGFPKTLLSATILGSPEIVDKTSDKASMRFQIRVEPDLKVYKSFVERLKPKLETLSKHKGEFTAVFEHPLSFDTLGSFKPDSTRFILKGGGSLEDAMSQFMPKSFNITPFQKLKPDPILVVTTQCSKFGDRMECRYYVFDKSIQPLLADVAFRRGNGKLSLVDESGDLILADRFSLNAHNPAGDRSIAFTAGYQNNSDHFKILFCGEAGDYLSMSKRDASVFWICPVFIPTNTTLFEHTPFLQITRTISMGLDELKSVKSAKCEISFDE